MYPSKSLTLTGRFILFVSLVNETKRKNGQNIKADIKGEKRKKKKKKSGTSSFLFNWVA